MTATAPVALRPMAALTVIVVLVHALVLREAAVALYPGDGPQLRAAALSTRAVPPATSQLVPDPTPTPAPAPAPAPALRKKPAVTPAPPRPVVDAPSPSQETAIASNAADPFGEMSNSAIDSEGSSTPTSTLNPVSPTMAEAATTAASTTTASTVTASLTVDSANLSATVPPSARLLYNLTGQARNLDYIARGEVIWRQDGQRYALRLSVSAFLIGARSQTSEGDVTPQGLAPRRHADQWRGEQAAHFNRETQRITFSANTPDVPLLPGAQDRLSLSVQIGALMAANPARMAPGTSITLQTANTRAAEPWKFTSDGEERLDLPFGVVQAFRFSRTPRREYDTRVEVWIAPSLNHAAVRVRVTQGNGDFVDQVLRAIEPVDDLR